MIRVVFCIPKNTTKIPLENVNIVHRDWQGQPPLFGFVFSAIFENFLV